jgi:hypothetical protein
LSTKQSFIINLSSTDLLNKKLNKNPLGLRQNQLKISPSNTKHYSKNQLSTNPLLFLKSLLKTNQKLIISNSNTGLLSSRPKSMSKMMDGLWFQPRKVRTLKRNDPLQQIFDYYSTAV